MATVRIPNEGESKILQVLFKGTETYRIDLYVSDTTPDETDTNTTHEIPNSAAFQPFFPTADNWTVVGSNATCIDHEFVTHAPIVVYGITLKAVSDNSLISVQRFDTPIAIGSGGGSIIVTPKINLFEEAI